MAELAEQFGERELREDIAGFWHDPLGYVLYAFPWGSGELSKHDGPDEWQKGVLEDIGKGLLTPEQATQIATVSGNDIGKSALIAWIILWSLSTFEDTKGIVTANTEVQLKTKTWPELVKWHRLAINKHWFEITATAIFSAEKSHEKTWRFDAVPWTENRPEAFSGAHNEGKRIVFLMDEGSAIPDIIWEMAEPGMLDSSTETIWCVFGNGTRTTGRFRECFRKFKHRWITRQIDSRNCKIANKEKIQQWIEDYGIDSDYVKIHVRGMFPAMSALQFISETDVDSAYGRSLRPEKYEFAPKILTCDPAWSGSAELVIGLRQGLVFSILRTLAKNDNDFQVANIIADLEDTHQVDAVFIDGGYGTGIVSAGKVLKRDWQIVWFASESSDPGCLNKRAQMWKEMRDWLKAGGCIPADPMLRDQLITPEAIGRADGKIQIQAKRDLEIDVGRADALAISFAYPVNPKVKTRSMAKTEQAQAWNPHDYL